MVGRTGSRRTQLSAAAISTLLLLAGCSGGTKKKPVVEPDPPRATTLTVSPTSSSLTSIDETVQFAAQVKDQYGQTMAGQSVGWATSAPTVATVNTTGLATSVSVGTATITATVGTVSGTATVTVTQAVASLAVDPDTITFSSIGATTQLTASVKDATGHDITSPTITWNTTGSSVVTVNASGMAMAAGEGTAWITADCGSERDSTFVVVALPRPASLFPLDWRIPIGGQVQFQADFGGPGSPDVVWLVNDVPGGDGVLGTVDATGLYTAPAAIPAGGTVNVRVRLASDPADFMESPVTVTDGSDRNLIQWHVWTPRAIDTSTDEVVTFDVSFGGYPRFEIERPGGSRVDPIPYRSGTYRFVFEVADLLSGYDEGDLHEWVGYLHCIGCENLTKGNSFVNVRDASVPDVEVTSYGGTVQAGTHVVNIRYDARVIGGILPTDVLKTFYSHFPDDFDFTGVIEQQNSFNNRFYRGVRNQTQGLGAPIFDGGAQWGSPARLQGIIHYPVSGYFDAAEKATVHEIGHRWIMYLDNAVFAGSGAHWPISTMSRGIMGYSGAGMQGSSFPYEVQHVAGNVYKLICADRAREFNDFELYLMGLLPAASVGPHAVFQDQNMALACDAQGPTDAIPIDDVIAVNGARVPGHGAAQTQFRFATIILSAGRLLDEREMAFFNHMAARGEATTELRFTSGFSSGMTKPFFLATGGRGTLITRILP